MGLHHAPLFLVVIFGSFLQTTQDHPPITVKSCQYTDVLLECNCSKMTDGLKWQKNDELIYLNNTTTESYTNRIKIFLNENSKNCSILLKNITENDSDSYKCNFNEGETYSRNTVMLQVNMNSTQCSDHETMTGEQRNKDPSTDRPEAYSAFIIIIPALLLFGLFGFIFTVLRKRRRNQLHKQEVEPVGCHFSPLLIIRTPGSDEKP